VPHASRPWSLYGLQLGAHPLRIGQPTGYAIRGVSTMFSRPGYVLANSTCHDGYVGVDVSWLSCLGEDVVLADRIPSQELLCHMLSLSSQGSML
jgi:hypothetical protein